MMDPHLVAVTAGATGQLARILVGYKKALDATDKYPPDPVKWDWLRCGVSVAVGSLAGLCALSFSVDPTALFLAGYAGADCIEGLVRKNT
jgi:hypothetical protein